MKWFHFILSHSIFIAFCAVALAFQTSQLRHLDNSVLFYGFIFFATLCSYNFYWLLSKFSFIYNSSYSAIIKNEMTGIFLLIIAAIGLVVCLFYSAINIDHVIIAVLLTFIYAIPLLPVKELYFIRKAGVLKTFLLAFTWAYVTAFLPLQKSWALIDNADVFIITRRFLFMLMLCIIFDNRDKAVDKIRGLRSLATDLRPGMLRLLIFIIFAVLFGTNFFYKNYELSLSQSIALQVSTLALLIVYFFSTRKQGYFFYYFIVDGLMMFSALATFVAGI